METNISTVMISLSSNQSFRCFLPSFMPAHAGLMLSQAIILHDPGLNPANIDNA